ncbi:ABC-F family ATP-binding cassette domain-containing protein [Sporosarcina ureilytica]|uniref:Multidrug ABC transporter ATP-binding protein n=1 Tax=Sporosarcina ureilytica TaxID=298596 RepID=A0A1D8JG51_9BACL|nr:ABC-F family ATP-binding cassette domain-containing protein [Sporosarcina ureilytica]AOV07680.1 multidrug ABC transporter ATP-binding protein [Sporosarcina ureilytica]
MSQLIVEKLSHTIGAKTLFKEIDFTITSGEKVGLIGINGTGKSTLLSILAGLDDADSITMDHPNDYRIVYLPQEPEVDPKLTVLETVFKSDAPLIQMNLAYEYAVQALTEDPANEEIQKQFEIVQNEMDTNGGWDLNSQARTILTRLGITTFDKKMGELSGGQQKRVALAKVLIEPSDLLLLDEPTNHLDVESITWLQDYLMNEQAAVIFVTHDRYFLDAVSTHIYELADQQLYTHTGNYGDFIESKALREEMQAATESKLQNRFRAELKWIKRGARARSTKQKARIGRFEELKEQVKKDNVNEEMDANLKTTRLGRKVIEATNLSKSFGDKKVIDKFSCLLQSGDRIAIVGPNGVGKTTLLNLFSGEITPDAGELEKGSTVKIAHFHQHIPKMDDHKRMIEYIRETSNDIEDASGQRISASQMLERFLFPSRVHGTLIEKLSGGERKRLYLLKLLMEQPNVLLLDEPTNDLDIDTLSILEDFIETFPGVVLTISHDRFFLDRTSSKLWVLDGTGKVDIQDGVYTDYLETLYQAEETPEKQPEVEPKKVEKTVSKKRMSYMERKEWDTIEQEIETIEMKIEEIETEMESAGSDYDKLRELTIQLEEKTAEYERLFERWSYLQELQENM